MHCKTKFDINKLCAKELLLYQSILSSKYAK